MRVTFSVDLALRRPRPPRRRRLAAAGLVALLAIPATALASHQFADVPAGHTFHADIARARGAGLTAGCSATRYCPDEPVTRGQMAAFLNRGLGRLGAGTVDVTLSSNAAATAGYAVLQAGNVQGGTSAVVLMASLWVATETAGCPCEVRLSLIGDDELPAGPVTYVDLPAIPAGQVFSDASASLLGSAVVQTGIGRTWIVRAQRMTGTGTVTVRGRLQAISVPFDHVGGNPVLPAAAAAPDATGR